MTPSLKRAVRRRAQFVCEYCHLPEALSEFPFAIDHIISRQLGGRTIGKNLAFCCGFCNRHKGPNVAAIDTESHTLTALFNPRRDDWRENFNWRGPRLISQTAVGRVKILVLAMNHPTQVGIRRALMAEGIFPRDM